MSQLDGSLVTETSSSVFNGDERCSILSTEKSTKICWSVRCTLAIMILLETTLVYMLRTEVSVAIVEMVNHRTAMLESKMPSNSTLEYQIKKDKVYDWSSEIQGWILSAFYYGYIVSQIPGGYLAKRFGGKLVLGISVLLSSISTLLVPLAAELGAPCMIPLRVLAGLSEGPTFSAIHHMCSQWAPASEQSRFLNLAHSGTFTGTVTSFILSGMVSYYLEWLYSFYIFGSLGIVWCLVWFWLVSDTPETHRTISDAERNYIISSRLNQASQKQQSVPWKSIMKSSAVWAIITSYLSFVILFYTLMAVLPTYMKDVFQFTSKQGGILSAVQFVPSFLFMNIGALIADYMKKTGKFSTALIRKGCSCIGMVTASAFLIAVGFVKYDYKLAVILLTISFIIESFSVSGIIVNDMDIAPAFAGTIFGIVNTFATLGGMIGPVVAKTLTKNHTPEEWQTIFFILGSINILGASLFMIYGKGTVQSWAMEKV